MTPDAPVPEVVRVDAWWSGSVRPDLWTPGEWDSVEHRHGGPGEFVQAFQVEPWANDWLVEALHRGYGAPGLAESLVLADLIDAQPWT